MLTFKYNCDTTLPVIYHVNKDSVFISKTS
nr:MAG TPA: hypothetical protein [Caudoviricetes sp.]